MKRNTYARQRSLICRDWLLPIAAVALASIASRVTADQEQQVEPATIEGTITYQADSERPWRLGRYYIKDKKRGQLAEAVVALRGDSLKRFPPPKQPGSATVDQKNFRFIPETLAIRSGTRVKFLNSDGAVHNVKTSDGPAPFNINMPSGGQFVQPIVGTGGIRRPLRLGCSFHSAMQAWIFVFDHPFFQVTQTDGRFQLKDVPPGKYRLEMAHPAGELGWSREIELAPGEKLQLDIRVSPDDKKKS